MMTKKASVALGLLASAWAGSAVAGEGPVPYGIPRLDHVFVVMMENHGFSQIKNNPNAPFTNQFAGPIWRPTIWRSDTRA